MNKPCKGGRTARNHLCRPFRASPSSDTGSQGVALGCPMSASQAEERTPAHLASGQSDTVLRLPCLEPCPSPQNPCNVAAVSKNQGSRHLGDASCCRDVVQELGCASRIPRNPSLTPRSEVAGRRVWRGTGVSPVCPTAVPAVAWRLWAVAVRVRSKIT